MDETSNRTDNREQENSLVPRISAYSTPPPSSYDEDSSEAGSIGGFKTARASPVATRPNSPDQVDPPDAMGPFTHDGPFVRETKAKKDDDDNLAQIIDSSAEAPLSTPLVTSIPPQDIMHRIKGMYRLLHLASDKGVGGAINKVVIDTKSIECFANQVEQNSYISITKVNFRALDNYTIKPRGVYGSLTSLVSFLEDLGRIDQETKDKLLVQSDESESSTDSLQTGLYLLDATEIQDGLRYIVYWPEKETWNDNAPSTLARNRVTFMRYLTKLCDQVVCLISDEHADKFVWEEETPETVTKEKRGGSRKFRVEETQNQNEDVLMSAGFTLHHPCFGPPKCLPPPEHSNPFYPSPTLLTSSVAQRILRVEYNPGAPEQIRLEEESRPKVALQHFFNSYANGQICLSDELDKDSLSTLLSLGLCRDTYFSTLDQWKAHIKSHKTQWLEKETDVTRAGVKQLEETLNHAVTFWFIDHVSAHFKGLTKEEILSQILPTDRIGSWDYGKQKEAYSELDNSQDLCDAFKNATHHLKQALDNLDPGPEFQALKEDCLCIEMAIDHSFESSLGASQDVDTMTTASTEVVFTSQYIDPSGYQVDMKTRRTSDGDVKSTSKSWRRTLSNKISDVSGSVTGVVVSSLSIINPLRLLGSGSQISGSLDHPARENLDTRQFWEHLQSGSSQNQSMFNKEREIRRLILLSLTNLYQASGRLLSSPIQRHLDQFWAQGLNRLEDFWKHTEMNHWKNLHRQLQQTYATGFDKQRPYLVINKVVEEGRSKKQYRLHGLLVKPTEAQFQHSLYPFEVSAEDMQAAAMDPSYNCQPRIVERGVQTFKLPIGAYLRYIRLIGKDDCLAIIHKPAIGGLHLFYDDCVSICGTVEHGTPKRKLVLERVGDNALFALDEMAGLLAILGVADDQIQIHTYKFDEKHKNLVPRKPYNITAWYPNRRPQFQSFDFIPGREELILLDELGEARVFSISSTNFSPKTLHLDSPKAVLPTPDGAAVIVLDSYDAHYRLRCFHRESFDDKSCIQIPLPLLSTSLVSAGVTFIGTRDRVQLLLMDADLQVCNSYSLHIVGRASIFSFRSLGAHRNIENTRRPTSNNCLLDCHVGVWTRYALDPPIKHQRSVMAIEHLPAILIMSRCERSVVEQYFAMMMRKFKETTKKPSKHILDRIQPLVVSHWAPAEDKTDTSRYQIGDWLVSLFCLIPIHIAYTDASRFIPVKDGVASAQFERTLLGCSQVEITHRLSLGWYESIFTSYLSDLPVKVVTSMGEQSVGKSYSLNHFVDTSFAGSAMRCTEGVWLSVTRTRDILVVAMDFEGLQTIERTPQEDMLLILLNTAISNMVLFRNNFALSRDLQGLFRGFQSCTNSLNPDSNLSLFRSQLQVIIKDVTKADEDEMVTEFATKLSAIVSREMKSNFLTKLHRGNFAISPWPVIESPDFYNAFNDIYHDFMDQPITHEHAGAFYILLKTLMAKIYIADWSAVDQSLALHRAELLESSVDNALCFGLSDPGTGERLKNYDNDKDIPTDDDSGIFFSTSSSDLSTWSSSDISTFLDRLRSQWPEESNRFQMTEAEYMGSYRHFLRLVIDSRIILGKSWVVENTRKFLNDPRIQDFIRSFDFKSKILSNIEPCASRCSDCFLLCLDYINHDSRNHHSCKTDHRCPTNCEFEADHEDVPPPCEISAGHAGKHTCSLGHRCGEPCLLRDKGNCLRKCAKQSNHEEAEHMCEAPLHTCAAPCDLKGPDGAPICTLRCVTDSRITHDRHCCDRPLTCPMTCLLCQSPCATRDHFHALESNTHLCGQEHSCKELCELPGICFIEPDPKSVESVFSGRYGSFQYTKYTQVPRRLGCEVKIPRHLTRHEGRHTHSVKPDVFHFCETRCNYCDYFCTLEYGHDQEEHETGHGSMERAKWFLDGDEDAFIGIDDRKYATGDSGGPMLCSMLCLALGRHVHVSDCWAEDPYDCQDTELEHIHGHNLPRPMDWISHRLFWKRSGFMEPPTYTQKLREKFALCDRSCPDESHDSSVDPSAKESHCTLPLFHPPALPPIEGHVSSEGHVYTCPAHGSLQRFHIFLALDRSSSMQETDHLPSRNTPVSAILTQRANNRFGAVLSATYAFWLSREAAISRITSAGRRKDFTTVVAFNHLPMTICSKNDTMNPDQLLALIPHDATGWTNFTSALRHIQKEMEKNWDHERTPVIVFLSDGEDEVSEEVVYRLCRRAEELGNPCLFYAVSFGMKNYSGPLRRMVEIAQEVYDGAQRQEPSPFKEPCRFYETFDPDQLTEAFLHISRSLKPRAALVNV